MNASKTVLGFVPARLRTRVISRRSMAVLLSAEAIVKPPMRSMMVGENICEKTYLVRKDQIVNSHQKYDLLGSVCSRELYVCIITAANYAKQNEK
jgi:transposase-like protein